VTGGGVARAATPWLVHLQRTPPPDGDAWLAAAERRLQERLTVAPRRRDWRLGRWAAKAALRAALDATGRAPRGATTDPAFHARLAVLPDADGAPVAYLDGAPLPWPVSLTHRGGLAACAVAPAGVAVGCDLELVEPRSPAFVADYLTAAERRLVESAANPADAALRANLLWSSKESALKALRTGLTRDTRSFEVRPVLEADGEGQERAWLALKARNVSSATGPNPTQVYATGETSASSFTGWWRRVAAGVVLTVLTRPVLPVPPALTEA
jgi:4'-phosphopantetheinyl transferase